MRQNIRILTAIPLAFSLMALSVSEGLTRIEETSDQAPHLAYIPFLTGASLQRKTPETIATWKDLALAQSANKFVRVSVVSKEGITALLRDAPDASAMHAYEVALDVRQPSSASDYRASVRQVMADIPIKRKISADFGTGTGDWFSSVVLDFLGVASTFVGARDLYHSLVAFRLPSLQSLSSLVLGIATLAQMDHLAHIAVITALAPLVLEIVIQRLS